MSCKLRTISFGGYQKHLRNRNEDHLHSAITQVLAGDPRPDTLRRFVELVGAKLGVADGDEWHVFLSDSRMQVGACHCDIRNCLTHQPEQNTNLHAAILHGIYHHSAVPIPR
jgi:hypothetical protein